MCASSESDHQNPPTSAPSTVVFVPRPSVYQPTAPRSRSFAGVCVTSANPLLQPRPTSAQRVHPMGIEIVPHPRVQYTDRTLISVDEDGFGTGRPVVPLSRSRCPVSRSCCPFPVGELQLWENLCFPLPF